jgi:hypothetical protein
MFGWHQYTGEWAINCDIQPSSAKEVLSKVNEPRWGVRRVRAETNLRPIGTLIKLVRKWLRWKAMAIDNQAVPMMLQGRIDSITQGGVVRIIEMVD